MKKMFSKVMGAILVLMTAAGPVLAQDLTPPPAARSAPVSTTSPSAPSRAEMEGAVIIAGHPRAGEVPYGPRSASDAPPQVILPADFIASYGQAAYVQTRADNSRTCARVGTYTARAMELFNRSDKLRLKYDGLNKSLLKLSRDSAVATWIRRIFGFVAIGIAATISGPYAGIVGSSVLGNEAMGTASDRGQRTWRDHMAVSNEAALINVDAMMLWLESIMWWYEDMAPLCARTQPTSGEGLLAQAQ